MTIGKICLKWRRSQRQSMCRLRYAAMVAGAVTCAAAVCLVGTACAAAKRNPPATQCGADTSRREPTVPAGINKPFEHPDVAKWTSNFETESREIFHLREQIVDCLRLRPGMAVADIGAGTGFFSLLFAQRVGQTGHVYGVEISEEFTRNIRKRADAAGLPQVEAVLCRVDDTMLPPASIDLAFVCDTYHHFEHPRRTLESIHRALRPGGEMVVIDFERIEGHSREWVLSHVRAGRDVVISEICTAGFEWLRGDGPTPALNENYWLRFRKR